MQRRVASGIGAALIPLVAAVFMVVGPGARSTYAAGCSVVQEVQTPYLNAGSDVETSVTIACAPDYTGVAWVKVIRVISWWPDKLVAQTTQSGTASVWALRTWGCERPGEEHPYKGQRFHGYFAGTHTSSVVSLTCY